METWEDRVLDEQHELRKKIRRLHKFIGTSEFMMLDEGGQKLITDQFTVMNGYFEILQQRIEMF